MYFNFGIVNFFEEVCKSEVKGDFEDLKFSVFFHLVDNSGQRDKFVVAVK